MDLDEELAYRAVEVGAEERGEIAARGPLIDTDALVDALAAGSIGGAALDVTDPEPLPGGHPLWAEPHALITPHIANPPAALADALAKRIEENVSRFGAGDTLIGVVDLEAGY